AFVVAHDDTTHRARAGGAGPDDVRVDGIGRGPSALAAANCMPHAARDRRTRTAVARTAVRWIVLLVAVDVVRDVIISGDVVHLGDRKLDVLPRSTAGDGQRHAAIVGNGHAIAITGIDPHVVVVAAGARGAGLGDERRAAVDRFAECGGQEIRLILVIGRDRHP